MPKQHKETIPHVFRKDQLIRNKWRIVDCVGVGAYGEIYSAKNEETGNLVAIKIEEVNAAKPSLECEVGVLKLLKGCPHVSDYICCGRCDNVNYAVMSLLGVNLSAIRKFGGVHALPQRCVSRLILQCLECIRDIHERNIVHRDIKPSNFVFGPSTTLPHLYLIDFGLSRKYLDANGRHKPDLGRRDDLWSLVYVAVELCTGTLPWRSVRDKDEVGRMKEKYSDETLVQGLPEAYGVLLRHVTSLGYADTPDYETLIMNFATLYYECGGKEDTPYHFGICEDKDLIYPIKCDTERPVRELREPQPKPGSNDANIPPKETQQKKKKKDTEKCVVC